MKKLLLILCGLMFTSGVFSQNIQVHYDFGKDRKYVTTTLEMFKPDKWGSTFFFVDYDYDAGEVKGVSTTYMEIARALKFWDMPLAIQLEYNGGFGQFAPGMAFQINDAYLGGLQYTWNNDDFSKVLTIQALYKYIRGKHDASFQLTGVWGLHFFNRKLSFTGFADFWMEEKLIAGKDTKFVFLTEPQLWYNFTKNISLGSEVEVGYNFVNTEGITVCPTLAAKWSF